MILGYQIFRLRQRQFTWQLKQSNQAYVFKNPKQGNISKLSLTTIQISAMPRQASPSLEFLEQITAIHNIQQLDIIASNFGVFNCQSRFKYSPKRIYIYWARFWHQRRCLLWLSICQLMKQNYTKHYLTGDGEALVDDLVLIGYIRKRSVKWGYQFCRWFCKNICLWNFLSWIFH